MSIGTWIEEASIDELLFCQKVIESRIPEMIE